MYIEEYPAVIRIASNHNHRITAALALKFRDPSNEVKDKFLELFKAGHSPSHALELHKKDLMEEYDDEYYLQVGDRSICPDINWIFSLYYKTFKDKYGSSNAEDLVNSLNSFVEQYNLNSEGGRANVQFVNEHLSVAVITPLMARAHSLKTSGEIVFIDSSGNMDRYNCRVFLIMTDSCIGGLPLGVLITSSESEVVIYTALQQYTDILPENAFGGRGKQGPVNFMTDNSSAEINALTRTFPAANLLLCAFHFLQFVWRWLWEQKHGVKNNDRVELYRLVSALLYASSIEDYQDKLNILYNNQTVAKYSKFKIYVAELDSNSKKWALCHRSKLIHRSNNTNNIVEAANRVMKDKILHRTRAYSIPQLFNFVTDELSSYYMRKIVHVVSGRLEQFQQSRYKIKSDSLVGLEVKDISPVLYSVSNVKHGTEYTVNIDIGYCSCPVGCNGSPCKHQHAVAKLKNIDFGNRLPATESTKEELYWIATSKSIVQQGWFGSLTFSSPTKHGSLLVDTSVLDTVVNLHNSVEPQSAPMTVADPLYRDADLDVHEDKKQASRANLESVIEGIMSHYDKNPVEYEKAITAFTRNYKTVHTESAELSALHMFVKNSMGNKRSTAIAVQPTAVARRKIRIGGRKCQITGRVPKSAFIPDHAYVKQKLSSLKLPTKAHKAPHSLAACVDENRSIGKNHSSK